VVLVGLVAFRLQLLSLLVETEEAQQMAWLVKEELIIQYQPPSLTLEVVAVEEEAGLQELADLMEGLVVKGHFLAVAEVEAEQVDTQRQLVLGVLEVLVEKVELKFFSIDKKNATASPCPLALLLFPKEAYGQQFTPRLRRDGGGL
jgi:hypothetical protein